jgi:hypothetical protein
MNQDQKDRALRSVFFGQPGPLRFLRGKMLDDSMDWSQDRLFQRRCLSHSLTRAQFGTLLDLWFFNLSWQNHWRSI